MACDVSIVVPTHNRSRLLARTLESLLAQVAPSVSYEVLVVDNNSADDTREVVQRFCRGNPNIRYLFEPRPGVSNARNAGIEAAGAPIVAFIDDDVEADPGWVAAIKRALDAHPEVDCVGGRINGRFSHPPPRWLTSWHWGPIALQAEKGVTPYVDATNASPCLLTANFACRRAALEQVGGFSPDFVRDEDRELQLRLWEAGKRGMYVGDIIVTTEVPAERLTKAYHRQHQARVGASHARMKYLDRLDWDGRLIHQEPRRPMLLGTPGFIYRDLVGHAMGWLVGTIRARESRAFYHETRARYFCSYIVTRARDEGRSLWALPVEMARLPLSVVQHRVRRRRASPGHSRWSRSATNGM